MEILLVTNRFKKATYLKAQQITKKLREANLNVFIDDGTEDPFQGEIDIIIVLGGDGTILRAARRYGQLSIPVLGVNMGTVGFLCKIQVDELDNYIDSLIKNRFSLDSRMMIDTTIYNDGKIVKNVHCLNEVVMKSRHFRMVNFGMETEGEELGRYRGDGVIISTPTGSTAYSLSAGGPVVDPLLQAFLITPIASYDINKKPLIVSPKKSIRVKLLEDVQAAVCIDGQVYAEFGPKSEIHIKKAESDLKLIDFKQLPFFKVLDNRLRCAKGEF